MGERGFSVDHSTINRWVPFYSPQLEAAFKRMTIRGKTLAMLTQIASLGRAFMEREMRLRGMSTSNTVTLTC